MDKAKEALEKLGVATIAIMPEVLAGGSPVVVGGVVAGAALVLVGAAVGYGIYYFFFKKSNDPQQEPLLGDQQKRIQERIREILQEYGDVPARNIYTDEQLNQISSISTQSFVKTYQELLCPITNQLFIVPVSLRCSHQFERSAIVQHIVRSGRCPTCNQQAKIQDIRVAQGTTNAVERWRKRAIKKGRQYLEQRIKADFDNQIVS